MRRFLYFIPGLSGLNAKVLGNLGLLDRFTGAGGNLIEHCVTAVQDGPMGKGHGCIVAAGAQPPVPQPTTWLESKTFCVAIEDPQLPPRPQDLERPIGIIGTNLTLADERAWRVPWVRRWDAERRELVSNLPQSLRPTFDAVAGRTTFVQQVKPEYAAIAELGEQVFRWFYATTTLPLDEACTCAARLLAVNYRLGVEEVGLLGLLDEAAVVDVLRTSIDYDAIAEQAKAWAIEGLCAASATVECEAVKSPQMDTDGHRWLRAMSH